MAYFPFFINLENKECLIFGGGHIAYRKISILIKFGAIIKVISPAFCDKLLELKTRNNIELIYKKFSKDDIHNPFLIIIATSNNDVNNEIYKVAIENNILVNVTDSVEKSTFIFPSIIKKKNIIIGISSSGKSPVYSRYLRENIEKSIPIINDKAINVLSIIRNEIKSLNNDLKRNIQKDVINKITLEAFDANEEELLNIAHNIIKEYGIEKDS